MADTSREAIGPRVRKVAEIRAKVEAERKKTIKVGVYITVEIDVDAFRLAYAADAPVEDIRNDVRYSVLSAITSGAIYNQDEGVVVDAVLKS